MLLTAAHGFGAFVGREFLQSGWQVEGCVRSLKRVLDWRVEPPFDGVRLHVFDLSVDPARRTERWSDLLDDVRPDVVFHNAMITPKSPRVLPDDRDASMTWEVNASASADLFRACALRNVAVLFLSTHRADEPSGPLDAYRNSKRAARRALMSEVETAGLRAATLELGLVTAPGAGHYRLEILSQLPVSLRVVGAPGFQPLALPDATRAVVALAEKLRQPHAELPSGALVRGAGPRVLPLHQYVEEIRAATEGPARPSLPLWVWPGRPVGLLADLARALPLSPFAGLDGTDVAELRRDFRATPDELEHFKRAAGLSSLRDPVEPYRQAAATEPAPRAGEAIRYALGGGQTRRYRVPRATEAGPRPEPAGRPLAGTRALIVGGAGFLGPLISDELRVQGAEVVGTTRDLAVAHGGDSRWRHADLLSDDAVTPAFWRALLSRDSCSCVVYNAALVSAPRLDDVERVNLVAPRALLSAIRALRSEGQRAPRLLYVSTGLAGHSDWARHPYSRTKRQFEDELLSDASVDAVAVRPNVIFEPGAGHFRPELAHALPVGVEPGRGRVTPIWGRELAIGMARILASRAPGPTRIFEAHGPETMTWGQYVETVRRAAGRHPLLTLDVPPSLVKQAARAVRLLTRPWRAALPTIRKLDGSALEVVLTGHVGQNRSWVEQLAIAPTSLFDAYRAWFEGDRYTALVDSVRSTDLTRHRLEPRLWPTRRADGAMNAQTND